MSLSWQMQGTKGQLQAVHQGAVIRGWGYRPRRALLPALLLTASDRFTCGYFPFCLCDLSEIHLGPIEGSVWGIGSFAESLCPAYVPSFPSVRMQRTAQRVWPPMLQVKRVRSQVSSESLLLSLNTISETAVG